LPPAELTHTLPLPHTCNPPAFHPPTTHHIPPPAIAMTGLRIPGAGASSGPKEKSTCTPAMAHACTCC
ncbi:hypothetical protein COCVIDRAFT_88557, partial [Bipolaris victoriae FI3]